MLGDYSQERNHKSISYHFSVVIYSLQKVFPEDTTRSGSTSSF